METKAVRIKKITVGDLERDPFLVKVKVKGKQFKAEIKFLQKDKQNLVEVMKILHVRELSQLKGRNVRIMCVSTYIYAIGNPFDNRWVPAPLISNIASPFPKTINDIENIINGKTYEPPN